MTDAQISEVWDRYSKQCQDPWTIANFMGVSCYHVQWAIDEAKRRLRDSPAENVVELRRAKP